MSESLRELVRRLAHQRCEFERVTLYVLGINFPHRIALRRQLADEGVFPA